MCVKIPCSWSWEGKVVTEGEGPVWFKLCVLRSTSAETVRKQI